MICMICNANKYRDQGSFILWTKLRCEFKALACLLKFLSEKQGRNIDNSMSQLAMLVRFSHDLDMYCTSHGHDDVIKWKHLPRYWTFLWEIHWSSVNSPHKGQWRGALMFSLICAWINGWVNNREAGDFRCHHTHYDITVMKKHTILFCFLLLLLKVTF